MTDKLTAKEPLLITDKDIISRGMLNEMSKKLSLFLESQNVNVGDHVIILTNDKKTILTCASACYESGLVLICLDPSLGVVQITSTLKLVKPKAVLADSNILRLLSNEKIPLPELALDTSSKPSARNWFTGKVPKWKTTHAIFTSVRPQTSTATATATATAKTIKPDQAAYIMFTSGTTDQPKGVVVTRDALRKHITTLCDVFGYSNESRLLCTLPTYHTDGLVHCCYVPLLTGMCIIHPGIFKASVDLKKNGIRHKPTHFLAVPTILSMVHDLYSDQRDLFRSSGTHTIISTAGVLEHKLIESYYQTFDISLRNFYGLTETISGALYCDTSIHPSKSLGIPIGVEARLVANKKIITDCHVPGELQLRSDQLMHSYFKNVEASAEVFDNDWFKTGDLFTIDEAGHYYFKARLKDIIKKGGVSIYPKQIKHHIINYPGISSCEIIGIPDPVFEEVIAACIVTDEHVNLSKLQDYCKDMLPNEMQPDHWVECDRLPQTAVGKTDKPKLLQIVEQRITNNNAGNPHSDTLELDVLNIAATIFNTDLESLRTGMGKNQISGWDSYAHLKFIKQIEKKFSIRLKARDVMQIETLEDVVIFIKRKDTSTEAA